MADLEHEGLTPEELEAMQEDDTAEDSEEELETEQPEEEDEEQEEEPEEEADPEEEEAPDEESEEEEEEQPSRDDGEEPEAEEPATSAPAPIIRGEKPADYDDRMQDIDRREEELEEKFEDGDITTREYRTELRKLNDERGDLKWQAQKAELAAEAGKAQAEAAWYGAVDSFFQDHPEIQANETRLTAFDAIVRKVTAKTMADGKQPGIADLNKAFKQWSEDLGITPAAKEEKEEQKPAKAKEPPKERKVPPSLAKVPAADATDVENGKFASLDRLAEKDPLKYQEAIDRMSPDERDAYNQYSG